ncbi:hypothetical protein GCK72_007272 [Caenorhabditis remanei]|uniref:Uncharacterized protein n=1 Tax=Caenorhabditis remanei TaxID=31234 RepID=A0A6A5HNF6_CAERE|nr:hypothetical protein GCK72_007271 [Caenorhabditis remanei]XP_053590272.1 hypothetical protein GCK72_007272 [Caenorhabditis remanei]KAF1767312.1 hypothetical protein GCK72_007271 [Caenorhabditis remanei]KAF1767313.1 hypothetical protein GCK72_007272 [Caenorhabditis remanei]
MTKPLTYLSLKAVFQYMDGNKRLELNFDCPALRSAESSVPLNLRSLILEKERIVVNDVCYKVKSKYQRIKTVLDGRKHVRVEILKLHDLGVIPECLKISTRNLDSGNLDFEEKEIGTVLTRQNGFRILPIFSPYVDELMDVLNGRIVFLNESVLQNNMDRRCLSFPFNKTSELVLYSIRDGPNEERRTKLEVMPIGSTGPGTLTDLFIELLILLSFIFFMRIVLRLSAVAMDSIGKTTLAYFR